MRDRTGTGGPVVAEPDAAADRWATRALAAASWYPAGRDGPPDARLVDRLPVPAVGAELRWVRAGDRSVLLAAGADPGRTSPALAAIGRAGGSWPTAAGCSVRWSGRAVDPAAVEPVSATASNDISRVRAGGRPALLKVFRLLGSDRGEARILAALAGTGLVPELLAEGDYRGPGRAPVPLALLTADIGGGTLDGPLREGLQAAWSAGSPVVDRVLLARVRGALDRLHRELAGRGGRSEPVPLAARLAVLRADADAVLAVTAPARRTPAGRLLDRALASCAGPGAYEPAPAHGDLHLSHVVLTGERVAFVDIGTGDADSCPADDGAALRRAVECLGLDELVDRMAVRQGREQADVADELTAAALAGAARGAAPPGSGRRGTVLAAWTDRVCAELDPSTPGSAGRVLYLGRLLHDLRHHAERADAYYTGLAWWHLAASCAQTSEGTP